MKRLLLIALVGIAFSCGQNESQAPDYSRMITSFDVTFKNTFHQTISSVSKKADLPNLPVVAAQYLKDNFYTGDVQFDVAEFQQTISIAGRVREDIALDLSFLTAGQQAIAGPFLQDVMQMEELTYMPHALFIYERQITNSLLTEVEKWQLFEISSLVRQAVQMIQDAQSGNVSRTQVIDVKGALRAGVIGLAVGATAGAYAGATGGTVVFPVVGTVTGGVAGAVVGGAIGFVTGVAESILQNLLFD